MGHRIAMMLLLAGCWSSTVQPVPSTGKPPVPSPKYTDRVIGELSKWYETTDLYRPSDWTIETPAAGGVLIEPNPGTGGKRRYIGFDFP